MIAPLPAPRGSKDNGNPGKAHHQGHGCERERDGHAHDDIGHGDEGQRQQAGEQLGHVAQHQVRARALQQDVGEADKLDGKAAAEIASGALGEKPLEQAHQGAAQHDHDGNGPYIVPRLNKALVTHRTAVDELTRSIAHEQHRQQQTSAHRGEKARHAPAEHRGIAAEPKTLADAPNGMVGRVRRDERGHEH